MVKLARYTSANNAHVLYYQLVDFSKQVAIFSSLATAQLSSLRQHLIVNLSFDAMVISGLQMVSNLNLIPMLMTVMKIITLMVKTLMPTILHLMTTTMTRKMTVIQTTSMMMLTTIISTTLIWIHQLLNLIFNQFR